MFHGLKQKVENGVFRAQGLDEPDKNSANVGRYNLLI